MKGQLDQELKVLHVENTIPRDVAPLKFDAIVVSLRGWLEKAKTMSYTLQEQCNGIDMTCEKIKAQKILRQQEKDAAQKAFSKWVSSKAGELECSTGHDSEGDDTGGDTSRLSKRRR